jgi:hypothetical protein
MKRLIVVVASLKCLALWPLLVSAETGFLDRTVTVAAETYQYQCMSVIKTECRGSFSISEELSTLGGEAVPAVRTVSG